MTRSLSSVGKEARRVINGVHADPGLQKTHQCDASGSGSDIQHSKTGVRDMAAVEMMDPYRVLLGLQDVVELGADGIVVPLHAKS